MIPILILYIGPYILRENQNENSWTVTHMMQANCLWHCILSARSLVDKSRSSQQMSSSIERGMALVVVVTNDEKGRIGACCKIPCIHTQWRVINEHKQYITCALLQ